MKEPFLRISSFFMLVLLVCRLQLFNRRLKPLLRRLAINQVRRGGGWNAQSGSKRKYFLTCVERLLEGKPMVNVARQCQLSPLRVSKIRRALESAGCSATQRQLFDKCKVKN